MNFPIPIPFHPEWPEPDPRFMRDERPAPPSFPVKSLLPPTISDFVALAAKAKGAPVDYVAMGLLVTVSSLIGNARWARPCDGWEEPPTLWAALIGTPSMGKSPGLDASLSPLKRLEARLRGSARREILEWERQAEISKVIEQTWKEAAKAAAKAGEPIVAKPDAADPGTKPELPRLAVSDATIEKLAAILQSQPKGVLQVRDELPGWLMGMSRYASGSSDSPFWLEAYGGRSYTVERIGRSPVDVAHLAIPVVGNIQPDRLQSLLMRTDDDGLLARIIPVWPTPAPLYRTPEGFSDNLLEPVFDRLMTLQSAIGADGVPHPKFLEFTENARDTLYEFRQTVRSLEADAEGLLLSFIGKLPGLAVRIALVLTCLDWACRDVSEPQDISGEMMREVVGFIHDYILPMAERSYGDASVSNKERAGRDLLGLIRAKGWSTVSSREVRRMQRKGLVTQEQIDMAIAALEQADILRLVDMPSTSKGGRPQRLYDVSPLFHAGSRPGGSQRRN
ncbi:DUF3987 domain-containing protein [Maritimibacter alkaliphilus]|uniref:DUF3987 domain-containing protein n=1 Tax=Maritimibacter alkaliphilus TaxID=404236 RepID=UPI001C943CC6|nr:DUF3987 domain-containing protein [Maritimibacter alkaliphilus]MBY6088958.1 DUF3987 domain-containing protein [Maritimibacter alkaliphilus]